jgi:hypothetical protein
MKSSKTTTITIKNEHLITGLLLFIILIALAYAFVPSALAWATTPKPAETVAREGAQAFLSTDVEAGREAWEKSVCQTASEQGCSVIKNSLGAMIWGGVEANSTRQSCQATSTNLTKDIPGENEHRQVWKVSLDCRDLRTEEIKSFDLLASVTEVGNGWKFERIMFEQEAQNAK